MKKLYRVFYTQPVLYNGYIDILATNEAKAEEIAEKQLSDVSDTEDLPNWDGEGDYTGDAEVYGTEEAPVD
jgi:hypothetical protein